MEAISTGVPGVRDTVTVAGESLLFNATLPISVHVFDAQRFPCAGRSKQSADEVPARQLREAFDNPRPILEKEFANPRAAQAGGRQRGSAPLNGWKNSFRFSKTPRSTSSGAAGRWPGHGRRLQDRHRGPQRPRPHASRRSTPRSSTTGEPIPGLTGCSPVSGPIRPGFTSISTARQAKRWACRWTTSSTRCRAFGSLYVNDFNRFGRTWQVNIQARGIPQDRRTT